MWTNIYIKYSDKYVYLLPIWADLLLILFDSLEN